MSERVLESMQWLCILLLNFQLWALRRGLK